MPNQQAILEIENLRKDFGKFVLNDISFSLPRGYIMGLIGPNGAGKTTTISLVLNMLRRDRGSIKVLGMDNIHREAEVKQKLGVVFDSSFYLEDWTANDVGKAIAPFYRDWDREAFQKYIGAFGLDPKKKVKELSRGMQTKLMLASAFSHNAELLILDEPTSGMDPLARDELLDLLRDYIGDGRKSVLFSTHITSDLEKAADFITYIRGGAVFYTGETDGLLEKYVLVKGGGGDLSDPLRRDIMGLRQHRTGFDGLMESAKAKGLPENCITDRASIEDIMLYTAKEENR